MTTKPNRPRLEFNLRRVRPTKVSTEVARQLLELIRSGAFPVGSRLPPEKELAERMGVSRASVREALAALGAVGLVESQPGRG
ncbi:MAG TPA: FadR family transcriptional regulator, partial [Candidatus Acetothermia bacterium]|nr:FadR family transcriptional regulator [Candidatus Acetothermia bacterium]